MGVINYHDIASPRVHPSHGVYEAEKTRYGIRYRMTLIKS